MNKDIDIQLRKMELEDIPLGMKLKTLAHWNQLPGDWEMILKHSKGGNFVALKDGMGVGTATTINYENKFSWIGMVLVDPNARRCGIGKKLLNSSIQYAKTLGQVCLDATPEGRKLYLTLGFQDEYTLTRMEIQKIPRAKKYSNILPIQTQDWDLINNYDQSAFGASRIHLLKSLQNLGQHYAFIAKTKNEIRGYCLGRRGEQFDQIGPILADSSDIAVQLLSTSLANSERKEVMIDVMDQQSEFKDHLFHLGFKEQRPFIRMSYGNRNFKDNTKSQYAISGPELG